MVYGHRSLQPSAISLIVFLLSFDALFSGPMDSIVLIFERNLLRDVDHSPILKVQGTTKNLGYETFPFRALRLRGGRRISAMKITPDDERTVNSTKHDGIIEKPCLKLPHTTRPNRVVSRPKSGQVSSDDDDNTVGMIHQEPTPSMSHHVDTLAPRDAASYAAEAARCLGELDVDGALACYGEAVRLEPRSGVLLDAYGSLLADCGRFPSTPSLDACWLCGFGRRAHPSSTGWLMLNVSGCIMYARAPRGHRQTNR